MNKPRNVVLVTSEEVGEAQGDLYNIMRFLGDYATFPGF